MEAGTETEAPRVFVSYSHDSPAHQTRVLELVQWLRMQGVNAWVDQFEESPPGGWARWCQEQVEEAKYVLVVCTETYERRAKREEEPGVGLGTVWEMGVIIDLAYRAQDAASKLIPVIFEVADKEHIPYPLNQETHYDLSTEGGEEDLYRRLTDQPDVVPMTLGQIAEMPSPVSQPRQAPAGRSGPVVQPQQVLPAPPAEPATASLADVIEGNWVVELHNPMGGVGVMDVAMARGPNGEPQLQIANKVGPPWSVQGQWEVLPGEQLILRGVQTMQMPFPQSGPYSVYLTFFSVTPDELRATTPTAGETGIWRRQ